MNVEAKGSPVKNGVLINIAIESDIYRSWPGDGLKFGCIHGTYVHIKHACMLQVRLDSEQVMHHSYCCKTLFLTIDTPIYMLVEPIFFFLSKYIFLPSPTRFEIGS